METKQCIYCHKTFQLVDWDIEFYKKIGVPTPTHCPDCRQQRRLASANQLYLYKRKCGATGKDIISNYHPDDPYIVYEQAYWFSEQWDPLEYGIEFDFSRPFFEQNEEFARRIPRPALHTAYEYDENSPYTNYAGKNKNCHMIFDSDSNESCYYSYSINSSKNCTDCYRVRKSELCYECVDCERCYGSWYLQDCQGCMGSVFLKDCVDVNHSFMCVGLRHKEYHVFNKPVTPEEYKSLLKQLQSRQGLAKLQKQFAEFCVKFPNKFMHGSHNEQVVGDYLQNCKAALECYDSTDLENCKYFYQAFDNGKDCMDVQEIGDKVELCYECSNLGYTAYNVLFSTHGLGNLMNFTYCQYCTHGRDLFACFGLRHKQFCIFNKQYSEDEYYALRDKIIAHMKTTGEWGENWPMQQAPFAYNESLAQDYFPLTKAEAQAQGLPWRDMALKTQPATLAALPDQVSEITEQLAKELLACTQCGRNYKFIAQELNVYKLGQIPLPTLCFYCRHAARLQQRNPRALWQRQCMCTQPTHDHAGKQCPRDFMTSYAPDRPELVYCEECYQREIY